MKGDEDLAKYLLAHDLGTSGNKATLYTTEGELVRSRTYSYDTKYSYGSWAEQNPEDWWKAVCHTTQELVQGIDTSKIAAVSFSAQMMGCVCIDKHGNPLRNSLIHSDLRATEEAKTVLERIDPMEFYRITGHLASASYSLAKLKWIKNNEPEIYKNTHKMLQAKDFLGFKLTGKLACDFVDASGTNAFDINKNEWSEKIIELAGLDLDKFPEVYNSTHVLGEVTTQAAAEVGLRAGTPVVLGAGDCGCATIGAGSIREGVAYNYIGSSSWIGITTDKAVIDEKMRTVTWAHPIPGYVAPMGTMQTAGSSYSWLKNEICKLETEEAKAKGISPYEIINAKIEQSPPGARGVLFLPYLFGERAPHWNPNAKGAFIGLTMEHKREDLLRSVLEGVSYNLSTILKIFDQHLTIPEMIVIGGGAKGAVWRQMLADIYQRPVLKPNFLEEATSMGAVVIGGVGVGVFKDFEVINKFLKMEDKHLPNPDNKKVYEETYDVFANSYNALLDIFDQLSVLNKS